MDFFFREKGKFMRILKGLLDLNLLIHGMKSDGEIVFYQNSMIYVCVLK